MILLVRYSATSQITSLSTGHSTLQLSKVVNNSLTARSAKLYPLPETENHLKATSTRCQRAWCQSHNSNRWQRWKQRGRWRLPRVERSCSSSRWKQSRRKPNSNSTSLFRALSKPLRLTYCSQTSILCSLPILNLTWHSFVRHSSLSTIRIFSPSSHHSSRPSCLEWGTQTRNLECSLLAGTPTPSMPPFSTPLSTLTTRQTAQSVSKANLCKRFSIVEHVHTREFRVTNGILLISHSWRKSRLRRLEM